MSDTFDHGLDAFESYAFHMDQGSVGESYFGSHNSFGYDPDYYHSWQTVDKLLRRTDKAIQVAKNGIQFWVPKSLIREEQRSRNRILVHTQIFNDLWRSAIIAANRDPLDDLPDLS
jgi:hypothetical protein